METTPYPQRAGLLVYAMMVLCLTPLTSLFAQIPTITVRFANPTYSCATGQYCLDVEFLSDSVGVEVFGMNVRFFYDDAIMELDSFTDFQGGYAPVAPDPPAITQSGAGIGYNLFGFGSPGTGVADFVNGAIMLADENQPALLLDTAVWTKIFQVCFTVENPGFDSTSFCPPVVWDLEQNPANGGFLIGDDGVVITIVSPDPQVMSEPSFESVVQFNWEYIGDGPPPYGQPVDSVCISLTCIPELVCPADLTLECLDSTDPAVTGVAEADTVCLADVTVSFSDSLIAGTCAHQYLIERTWIAINSCNISDTCIQTLTVMDTTAPVIQCPSDVTIECNASTTPDNTGFASATDVCDTLVLVEYADVTIENGCPNTYGIERTWTATDECGNTATCLQRITIEDATPPLISCPANITLQCTDPIPTDLATATDNCSDALIIAYTDVVCSDPVQGFTGPYDVGLWTTTIPPAGGSVTPMGNSAVVLVSADDTISCDSASVLYSITVSVTGQIAFTWNFSTVDGPSYDPFGYSLNGNFVKLTQDVGSNIQIGTASVAVSAGDVFSFEQLSTDCIFGSGTTTVIDFLACVEPTTETCSTLIIRNHTARDECGNESSCAQTIWLIDTIAPTLLCAPDITIDCDASTLPDSTGLTLAFDNCDTTLTVEYIDSTLQSTVCPQAYTIFRTWFTSDACGNADSCLQVIMVQDTTPPAVQCPPNVTIDCTASTSPDSTGMATAIDLCDTLALIEFDDISLPGPCAGAYVISRLWRATDDCGNSSSCVQNITVQDTTPPQLVCPDDITIDLASATTPDVTGSPTATDNCDPGPLSVDMTDVTVEGPCNDSYYIERTWSATDACGNTATCLQIIYIDAGCTFDLALEKEVSSGFGPYGTGDNIEFQITITNEGDFAVGGIEVTDYIPIGLALNDPDWTAGTNGSTGQSASIFLSIGNGALPPAGLLPTESVQVSITLQVQPGVTEGVLENIAEISTFYNTTGIEVQDDVDSNPDTNDANDPDAEDDHDPAEVCILNPPLLTGDDRVCPGDTITYTISNYNPALTYTFELEPGGGTIIATAPDAVTIEWGGLPGGPYTLTVTVEAIPGCERSSFLDIYIEGGDEIACIDHINLSIDNECGTVVLSGIILTGAEAGNNAYQVYIISMNGDTLPGDSLTWEHVGQTFKVSVVSECYGQSCWGSVTVEDKRPPIIDCVCGPDDTTGLCVATCQQIEAFLAGDIPEELRPVVIDSCGQTTLDLVNVDLDYHPCENGTIRVTWRATDSSGNQSTCEQTFTIVPLTLDSVRFPLDFPGTCTDNPHPDYTGWPLINGIEATPDMPWCNLYVYYNDQIVPLCGGGRKIIRQWTLIDWCTSETIIGIQTIYLRDTEGPQLTCISDLSVSTGVWNCQADVIVPKPTAIDACSDIKSYQLFSSAGQVLVQGQTYIIKGLPVGNHTATWVVKDECHNSSTCTIQIQVADLVPPVVSCHLHTVVALSEERPHGVTLVPATSFSDGSVDNCGPVTIRARRMDSCIDFDWTTGGACVDDLPGGVPAVNGFDAGTEYGTCVPFACCDVGRDDIMIQVEVTDASGNVNYCMVQVEVQDKIAPDLECPADIIVSCEFAFPLTEGLFSDASGNQDGRLDEDPLSAIFGQFYDGTRYPSSVRQPIILHDPNNSGVDQPHTWGIDGWASDMCEIDLSVEVVVTEDCSGNFNGNAPAGAVKLIERRFKGFDGSKSGSCMQRIWVVDFNRYYIADTNCQNDDPNDGVIWPCDVLINSCPDELGDTGEPIIVHDGCSHIGISHEDTRLDFAEGACYKILREWKIIDWCQFDPLTGYGRWTYTQAIKVADAEGVTFLDAPTTPQTYCTDDPGITLPANNQVFLGVNNPDASSCGVHVDLGLRIEEFCSESVIYDVRIYPFNGTDFIQLVPETEVDLDEFHQAELRFNTAESSDPVIALNGLPYNDGTCSDYHRVLWTVEDGCGNRSYADYLFALWDCKDPTPVCIDGLSTVVMPAEGEVTIMAENFNASSFDDCTSGGALLFSFSGDTYMPEFTYTCDNVPAFGVELDEEIWVADAGADLNCNGVIEWSERNKAFCVATILITDNSNVCGDQAGILTGEIMTEISDAVSPVTVHLSSPTHTIPSVTTGQDGTFAFTGVPVGADYTITTVRNDDHGNGVSTLDLVYIQKHLLGQQTFTSPYQYIAADANNSQSVSAIDIIELRKVILGLQDTFTHNTSWRFVEKGSPMAPGNPWPFSESIHISQLNPGNGTAADFVGVKIGDVNHSAKANAHQILPRSGERMVPVKVSTNDKIEVGAEIEIAFAFPEDIIGFQGTLETHGLDFVSVRGKHMDIGEQHVAKHGDEILTLSWNGEGQTTGEPLDRVMYMTFRVTKAGRLFEMLSLHDRITTAEAYSPEGEVLDIDLAFSSQDVLTEFALYQNKPNPWNQQTLIGFYLPHDSDATLTVYDVGGKVLTTVTSFYRAGFNTITLHREDYPSTGILYYRLDSGPWSATKKMVTIQ